MEHSFYTTPQLFSLINYYKFLHFFFVIFFSIVVATGDDGVAGYKARTNLSECKYTASFPATSPWVTAVGATQNAENDPNDHEVHTLQEYAANAPEQQPPFFAVTTAGGFSNYFSVPKFQAVSHINI